MKKRILAMLLCLTMVGTMLPVGAIAEGTEQIIVQEEAPVLQEAVCQHEAQGWTKWDGTGALPTSGNIILTQSVQLTGEYLLDGTTLSICLNGNSITAAAGKRVFHLTNSAVLNIHDCDGNGKITGANTADLAPITIRA